MNNETFIPDTDYDLAVAHLTRILRREHEDAAGRFMDMHAALRLALDLDMGDLVLRNGRVEPERYTSLVDALATLETDPGSGEHEAWRVRLVLGEEGDVWPARIREDHAQHASLCSAAHHSQMLT